MKEGEETLYIKNKITNCQDLSSNGYLAYLGVTMLLRQNEISYFTNTDYLAYLLSKKYPAEVNLKNNICGGIIELKNKKWITFEKSNENKQEWIINVNQFVKDAKIDKENKTHPDNLYTSIDQDGISKILSSADNYYTKAISLVRFYVYLLSTVHNKDDKYKGTGFTSTAQIAIDTGHSDKTVTRYIKQLVELEVIYVFRSKEFIKFDDGGIVEISHTYGRYKDKNLIDKIGKQHEADYSEKIKSAHKKISKSKAEESRKYSQMYKHFCDCSQNNKENPYTYDKCKEIYNAMDNYNKRYEGRKDRIKDLSVFSSFDFYKTIQ